jgi:Uncharacterised nucleotidyltransferase
MNDVLLALVHPSERAIPPRALARLAREEDWTALMPLVSRLELGALVFERLRNHCAALPARVCEWLDAQHRHTVHRNTALLEVLSRLTCDLRARGIPALVLKGPVLGYLGIGVLVRPFHDLDLLIKPGDLDSAAAMLRSMGFYRVPGAAHHSVFVHPDNTIPTIVEMHVDLADRQRHYRPDIQGIWNRSGRLDLGGQVVDAPGLTDHLLLAIMQLPHHHWSPRLLVDVAALTDRWATAIEWGALVQQAKDWGLRALAGSTFHAIGSIFDLPLPGAAREFAVAESYFRRVQWRIVRRAVLEHLGESGGNVGVIAPFVVLDRFHEAASLTVRTLAMPEMFNTATGTGRAPVRRLLTGASAIPSILHVLGEAVGLPMSRASALAGREKS